MLTEAKEEKVLVVPAERLHFLGYFQGFTDNYRPYWEGLVQGGKFAYLPRAEAESDPSWKQLIPYVVLVYEGSEGQGIEVFYYERAGAEERLQGRWSVGLGGHICHSDADSARDNPYLAGMKRELEEEVKIDSPMVFTSVLGLVNDDTNPVGQVHLGIVHQYRLTEPRARLKEGGTFSEFKPLPWLLERMDRFETWSQFCLQELKRRHA